MELSKEDKALFDAIKEQDQDKVKAALKDANINAKEMFDGFPLNLAATLGNLDVVKVLCENGADVNCKDSADMTALMNAVLEGHVEVAEFLLDKGAKITTDLAMSMDKKIAILEENAEQGMIKPEAVKAWKDFRTKLQEHSQK